MGGRSTWPSAGVVAVHADRHAELQGRPARIEHWVRPGQGRPYSAARCGLRLLAWGIFVFDLVRRASQTPTS